MPTDRRQHSSSVQRFRRSRMYLLCYNHTHRRHGRWLPHLCHLNQTWKMFPLSLSPLPPPHPQTQVSTFYTNYATTNRPGQMYHIEGSAVWLNTCYSHRVYRGCCAKIVPFLVSILKSLLRCLDLHRLVQITTTTNLTKFPLDSIE